MGLREGFTEKVILEQRPEGSDIPVDRAFWADTIACKDPRGRPVLGVSSRGEMMVACPWGGGSGSDEKWLDSDCLWKVVPTGFADR